jgi:hypothetical protein
LCDGLSGYGYFPWQWRHHYYFYSPYKKALLGDDGPEVVLMKDFDWEYLLGGHCVEIKDYRSGIVIPP